MASRLSHPTLVSESRPTLSMVSRDRSRHGKGHWSLNSRSANLRSRILRHLWHSARAIRTLNDLAFQVFEINRSWSEHYFHHFSLCVGNQESLQYVPYSTQPSMRQSRHHADAAIGCNWIMARSELRQSSYKRACKYYHKPHFLSLGLPRHCSSSVYSPSDFEKLWSRRLAHSCKPGIHPFPGR